MSKNTGWFGILGVAKTLGKNFLGAQLAVEAGIVGTDDSSPAQIAAAWLRKFEKWGYVKRTGEVRTEGHRMALTWEITEKGEKCEEQESLESRFARLLGALRSYQESIGQAGETSGWKKLCKVTDEVDLST